MSAVIFLCAVLAVKIVTANPLLQAIVSQSCPICEQNSLKGQLQNLLLQNLQPYFNQDPQLFLGQNPTPVQPQLAFPIDPCFCPQNVQNLPFQPHDHINQPNHQYSPQAQNDPSIPDVVNKILSNPNLRTVLDPNTKLFDNKGAEVPRNGPCRNGFPNIVNNYIIIPPELLLEDKDGKKVSVEKGFQNDINYCQNNDNKEMNFGKKNDKSKRPENMPNNNNRQRKLRRRPRIRNPDIKINILNENSTLETSQIEAPKSIKIEVNTAQEETRSTKNINDTVVVESNNKINQGNKTGTLQTKDLKPTQKQQTHQNKNRPIASKNTAKLASNRNYTPVEKTVIEDFKQKFPNIPEEIVIGLLEHMKRQLQNQNLVVPQFYYPQYPFPISYEQLFKNQFQQTSEGHSKKSTSNSSKTKDTKENTRRRQRKNKKERNRPRSTTTPECNSDFADSNPTTEKTTTLKNEEDTTVVPVTSSISTTDKPVVTETTTVLDVTTVENFTEGNGIIETTTRVYTESQLSKISDKKDIKEVEVPELGKEDKLPTILLNELLDEYYPDFTGDNQYFSDEDFSFVILDEDRYHYTTDKNIELETLNRERRLDSGSRQKKHPAKRYVLRLKNSDKIREKIRASASRQNNHEIRLPSRNPLRSRSNTATENPKVIVTIVTDENKSEEDKKPIYRPEEEKIEFKTPPKLENIDFETKQINKKYDDDSDVKTSTYSDVKTPQYNSKYKNIDRPKPIQKDKIETVFARSKVANYGTSPKYVSSEMSSEEGKLLWGTDY